MEAKHLQGKMAKGYPFSLRYLGSQLPPLPGKTSVLQSRIESHHSLKDMSRSRWDFRAKLQGSFPRAETAGISSQVTETL